ncbi:anti-sigma factor [Arcticibacterium luteifluviistationis]|uniref:Anti-sigma K factor RskA C-terminal domain-containing protein n=1 Tax=Arcticibacterium luteifluviistationis TaxID=1784714 RepID=A0A2Z4GFP2_9BACT|nr:anti-sigma factor [Arcticibacterium luteifluviistationis]AWW00210.1 hypothetical protein DJ013_19355 [Arcticibacterium luteifluviistationis]
MKKGHLKTFALAFMALAFTACDNDDEPVAQNGALTLNIQGLEDLGSEAVYEGWLITPSGPVSTGIFTVNGSGALSQSQFSLDQEILDAGSTFVLTIEPANDADPAPSKIHILAGDFSSTSADLNISHAAALGNDFSTAAGQFILATPSTETMDDETSGIWWLDPSGPTATLTLPTLPEGWVYEGWAVINGTPVSSGTFTSISGADSGEPFKGAGGTPPFPGEDFVANAPSGMTFPTNLQGGAGVISIEPFPDNSPAPFTLKPLVGQIAADAPVHSLLDMGQNLSFPTGTVSK